jgi:hypothetical protein
VRAAGGSRSATRAATPSPARPGWWAKTLAGFGDDGFDTVMFMPIKRTTEQVEHFAREVVPMLPGSAQ